MAPPWQYRVSAETVIDATPEKVWAVLTDFAGFDDWNPMLSEMTGEPSLGSRLQFTVTDALGGKQRMGGVVHDATPGQRLEWRGGSPLTFIGHHFFELTPSGQGTKLVHGETYYGLAPLLLRPVLNRRAVPLYAALNDAMKRFIEGSQ